MFTFSKQAVTPKPLYHLGFTAHYFFRLIVFRFLFLYRSETSKPTPKTAEISEQRDSLPTNSGLTSATLQAANTHKAKAWSLPPELATTPWRRGRGRLIRIQKSFLHIRISTTCSWWRVRWIIWPKRLVVIHLTPKTANRVWILSIKNIVVGKFPYEFTISIRNIDL